MDNDDAGLAVARTFATVHEAYLAKSVIEAAGIEVTLADEHVVSMNWMYSTLVGGVKVVVPADRLEEVLSLLDTMAVPQETPGIAEQTGNDDSD